MAPWRKCVLPGCQARQGGAICLFALPKNEETRKRWMEFVKRYGGSDLKFTTSTAYLCSQHFTTDSFSNWQRRQLGFTDNPLMLVSGAEPTIYIATDSPVASNDKVFLQYQRSRDIGCQTDRCLRSVHSVGTQLSKNTLVYQRSQGSQATVLTVSVAIGTPVQRTPQIQSSTFRKPFKPSKRRGLKQDDDHGVFTEPYIPGEPVSTETMLSQASPSINEVSKYIVDEYCLLELFEDCPSCGFACEVQKTIRGTFLAVHQMCLQCNFSRDWKSQQLEAVPSVDCTSDPESSAAVITEIIGFSDENDSSGEESSEVDDGEHNSDSDWDPVDCISESDADERHEEDRHKLCPECGAFFYNPKTHTCENKKPYSCNDCGKRFLCEANLKSHSKIHQDGYKHLCKYCFSIFRTRTDKLVHEQSHPPAEKPYQCPDCPEVFAKMQERRGHLVSHRGPRNVCLICNMNFRSNYALERHVVVHTKVKQFVCEVCQRSFTQQSHLKSHMRVHTGEKPYQCQHCDKSFNHNVSLKSHIQRYHGQVPDPEEKVQMSTNVSEVEKDETNEIESSDVDAEEAKTDEMEISGVDSDEAKRINTLCIPDNGGDEEKKETVGKRKGCTGRPIGRPKKNAVITLDDANQLKRQGKADSTIEEQEHDSDPLFEPSKRKRMKKKTGRPRGRPKNMQ